MGSETRHSGSGWTRTPAYIADCGSNFVFAEPGWRTACREATPTSGVVDQLLLVVTFVLRRFCG